MGMTFGLPHLLPLFDLSLTIKRPLRVNAHKQHLSLGSFHGSYTLSGCFWIKTCGLPCAEKTLKACP